jgi:hypothetical protein
VSSLNVFKSNFLRMMLHLLLRMELDYLAIQLIHFLTVKEPRQHGVVFLVIEKTGTWEDFSPIAEAMGENYGGCLRISRLHISWIANFFLSAPQQDDLLPESEYNESQHQNYQRFIKKLVNFLRVKHDIKVLVESNWIYGNSRDWHEVAESCGIRVVIILKEGWMSASDGVARVKRHLPIRKFYGTRIFTINEDEFARQVSTKKVSPSTLVNIGSVRHDSILQLGNKPSTVLRENLLSLLIPDFRDPFNSYPKESDEAFAKFINELNLKVVADFIELARLAEDWKFVIKTKVTKFSQIKLKEFITSQTLPENLSFIFGGMSLNILQRSSLAVSYHSTAVIDCVAMNTPVVIPTSYQNLDFRDYLQDYEYSLPTYADAHDLLSFMRYDLNELSKTNLLPPSTKRRTLLARAIGNVDGLAAQRAAKEIVSILR